LVNQPTGKAAPLGRRVGAVRLGTYLVTRDVGNLRCQAQMLKAIFGAIAMINWGQINIVLGFPAAEQILRKVNFEKLLKMN
jgi:hypothetical protein